MRHLEVRHPAGHDSPLEVNKGSSTCVCACVCVHFPYPPLPTFTFSSGLLTLLLPALRLRRSDCAKDIFFLLVQ